MSPSVRHRRRRVRRSRPSPSRRVPSWWPATTTRHGRVRRARGPSPARACRLAFYYLRDAGDADEATQDAFVKAYMHLRSYATARPSRRGSPDLVNGCLDRLKARRRRWQWLSPLEVARGRGSCRTVHSGVHAEDALVQRELQQTLGAAIDACRAAADGGPADSPRRRTPREISQITGMNENTVRVHLFRRSDVCGRGSRRPPARSPPNREG